MAWHDWVPVGGITSKTFRYVYQLVGTLKLHSKRVGTLVREKIYVDFESPKWTFRLVDTSGEPSVGNIVENRQENPSNEKLQVIHGGETAMLLDWGMLTGHRVPRRGPRLINYPPPYINPCLFIRVGRTKQSEVVKSTVNSNS